MAANFTTNDVSSALAASDDPKVRSLAKETQVVHGVWKILDVTVGLMGEVKESGGVISGGTVARFATKKAIAVADVANLQIDSRGVQMTTFVAGNFIGSIEMGLEVSKYTSPAKAVTFVSLKVAEKVVGAIGLADVDKCKLALGSLTVNAGTGVFTCVATGGALCMLGAASFALEAWNAYEQCRLPPRVGR